MSSKLQKSILKKFKEIEKSKTNLEELKKTQAEAERQSTERLRQSARDNIYRNWHQTLEKSQQIFNWLENFWKELDPNLLKELKILFPNELFLHDYFGVKWNLPREIFWVRDRRFMYDTPEYHWFDTAESLTKAFQPEDISAFHNRLHSGKFWSKLEAEVAEKLSELNDKTKNRF